MKKFIKSIPMATPGIALAFAALGNLLLLPFGPTVRYICGMLSLFVLGIFAMKLIFDSGHAKEELKTPVPLSVLPTATMAVMLLSTYIRPHIPSVALAIWYVAIAVHVIIMLVFTQRFVIGFQLGTVFPSWFIAGVGIVTASVTAPAMGALTIGHIAFWVGLILYFAILPLVILRMNKVRVFPEPARKTVAIFTAPMSLLIVGYFNSFVLPEQVQANPHLVYLMIAIAAASYIYVCLMMF
ncbi:MAG: TDT family transporter [Turicibacter sp.]|nr:TDT family transporter [Turicibacter sp.]